MTDFEKIQALDEIEREEEIKCFEALKDAKTTADLAVANDHYLLMTTLCRWLLSASAALCLTAVMSWKS